MMTNKQMTIVDTYSGARPWTPAPGSTTWYRGVRCTVLDVIDNVYVETMIRVQFADGRIGYFKRGELGLKAGDIARMR